MRTLFVSLPIFLFFLVGCSNRALNHSTSLSVQDRKIIDTIHQSASGHPPGPIYLSHRQLDFNEISNHLNMDEETTKKHLEATSIHGYYHLIAKNYPPDTEFTLYQVNMDEEITPIKYYTSTGTGDLFTRLDDTFVKIANNFLFFCNYLPGEPIDFVLASKNRRYHAATRIVPNPIEITDYKNHRISLEIASKGKREYLVHCYGLTSHGSYLLTTRFENERLAHTVEANEWGEIHQTAGPTIPWIASGNGFIELRGDNIDRSITLDFSWEI
ncbi:MAG: hypothetical protein WB791_11265 [Waddliaceae bacterium]